jgi:glutaminyl-peptide cyclotransferase
MGSLLTKNDQEKMKSLKYFLSALSLILVLSACTKEEEKPNTPPVVEQKSYRVPAFLGNASFEYVEKQVAFGPRVPNSDAHKACAAWIVNTLKSFNWEVIEQEFVATAYTGDKLQSNNIIAQYNPSAKKRILFGAHWDTRPFADSPLSKKDVNKPIDGADDGASGVGVLMELASVISQNPIDANDLGIDIIFFDSEDYGDSSGNSKDSYCLGSQYWAKNKHTPNYNAEFGILLDMVGTENARFTKEEGSMYFAGPVMNKVWQLAQDMGMGSKFVNDATSMILDDHYYVNTIAKIPMIDIINRPVTTETGFGHYWHTHDDNMDIISKNTMKDVGQLLTAIIYRKASGKF